VKTSSTISSSFRALPNYILQEAGNVIHKFHSMPETYKTLLNPNLLHFNPILGCISLQHKIFHLSIIRIIGNMLQRCCKAHNSRGEHRRSSAKDRTFTMPSVVWRFTTIYGRAEFTDGPYPQTVTTCCFPDVRRHP